MGSCEKTADRSKKREPMLSVIRRKIVCFVFSIEIGDELTSNYDCSTTEMLMIDATLLFSSKTRGKKRSDGI
jgi:hypothetical protein